MSSNVNYDMIILAGDIGGTNTNFALMGKKGGAFTLLLDRHYKTQDEKSLIDPLGRFLEDARKAAPGCTPTVCCISGAGPVNDNVCVMTNAPWNIDGHAAEKAFGFKTLVINDFTAVSYGVVLLDIKDEKAILRLPRADGKYVDQKPGATLVVGAGTGLGVGYLTPGKDGVVAHASEGGHMVFPVFDDESYAFAKWLAGRYDGEAPGAEALVSGMGIGFALSFISEKAVVPMTKVAEQILALPETDRPAEISKHASSDPVCHHIMERFVEYYGRYCGSLCCIFMPTGGLYLAGGVAAKNEAFFLDGARFMKAFAHSYREHTRKILADTPVFIAKDYSISLYGAANAAATLL